jgi:hypothetical protein
VKVTSSPARGEVGEKPNAACGILFGGGDGVGSTRHGIRGAPTGTIVRIRVARVVCPASSVTSMKTSRQAGSLYGRDCETGPSGSHTRPSPFVSQPRRTILPSSVDLSVNTTSSRTSATAGSRSKAATGGLSASAVAGHASASASSTPTPPVRPAAPRLHDAPTTPAL